MMPRRAQFIMSARAPFAHVNACRASIIARTALRTIDAMEHPRPFPAPRRKLRVAIVGAGMISEFHLRGWVKRDDVELVALVEPDAGRAERRASQFGIAKRFPSVEALLAACDIDALDVASPRETHGPILRLAAERGIASLCQKPFMPSLDEAEALVRDVGGRVRMMVNQNFRFRPYYQRMAAWIREGRLGTLRGCTINTRSSGLLRDAQGRYPYIERQPFVRGEKRLMIEEVLIHRIDIARWLCGPLELVAARTVHACDELAGESEAATLFVTKERGVPVAVDGNFASHGYPAQSHDRVEIAGEKGRVLLENDVLRLHGPAPEEIRFEHAAVYQESFDRTVAHFADGLLTGAPFLTPPEDNLETLRLVEAAYRAAGE
jgi:predicted dehydrogenase